MTPIIRLARFMLLVAAAISMAFVGCTGEASATSSPPAATTAEQKVTNYSLTFLDNKLLKGDTVEVIVRAKSLIDVYAFEVSLEYDSSKLKWLDAKTDVPGFTVKPIVENGQAKLAHTLVGNTAGISGSRDLFIVRFETVQPGRAEIVLREVRVVDSKLASKTEPIGLAAELMIAGPAPFNDLAGYEWAQEAIAVLASEGIIKGATENSFRPDQSIKRADFLLLLMRTLGLEAPLDHRFADVNADVYYADSVAMAAHLGIAKGDNRGFFHPAAPITREDMMVLTERALLAADRLSMEADMSVLQKYSDRSLIAEYAETSIVLLTELGIVEGYSNEIHPKRNANRAQAAMMIYHVFSYIRNEQSSPEI